MHITDRLEPCDLRQFSAESHFHEFRSLVPWALSLSIPSSGLVLFVESSLVVLVQDWRAPDDPELKRASAVAGRRPA